MGRLDGEGGRSDICASHAHDSVTFRHKSIAKYTGTCMVKEAPDVVHVLILSLCIPHCVCKSSTAPLMISSDFVPLSRYNMY